MGLKLTRSEGDPPAARPRKNSNLDFWVVDRWLVRDSFHFRSSLSTLRDAFHGNIIVHMALHHWKGVSGLQIESILSSKLRLEEKL